PFDFEDPLRAVERLVDQRAQHGLDGVGDGRLFRAGNLTLSYAGVIFLGLGQLGFSGAGAPARVLGFLRRRKAGTGARSTGTLAPHISPPRQPQRSSLPAWPWQSACGR